MPKKQTLRQTGEFSLIRIIEQLGSSRLPASVIAGIGDDAAVVAKDPDSCLLITADCLVENTHFKKDYTSAFLLGKKCIAVNISDIAAMGGTPLYYIVCLSAPSETPVRWVKDLYTGMKRIAEQQGMFLVGGDTVASEETVSVSVTVIGEAKRQEVVFRHGARTGDNIFLTGYPGDSALGLHLLEKGFPQNSGNRLIKKHHSPVPRVDAGQALSRRRIASSMIDTSDGIVSDMGHIMAQSRVGAKIFTRKLRLSNSYRKYASSLHAEEYFYPALCGGEDYELLFTAGNENTEAVKTLEKELGIPITCIGQITKNTGQLEIIGMDGTPVRLERKGFSHFK